MAKLINELLLLTCMGGFIASATYAVTLLHRAYGQVVRASGAPSLPSDSSGTAA
jgi:hypothetical protein